MGGVILSDHKEGPDAAFAVGGLLELPDHLHINLPLLDVLCLLSQVLVHTLVVGFPKSGSCILVLLDLQRIPLGFGVLELGFMLHLTLDPVVWYAELV